MDKNLDIQQKSKIFARRIIMLAKHLLAKNQKDIVIYIMVKQLYRQYIKEKQKIAPFSTVNC